MNNSVTKYMEPFSFLVWIGCIISLQQQYIDEMYLYHSKTVLENKHI